MINKYENPIIIINAAAKAGRSKKVFEKYYKILLKENFFKKIDIFESKSKEDTINLVKKLHIKSKNDLIISIGGDGSISTIVNGLMDVPIKNRLPIFPLPTGSGNSIVRDYGITNINHSIEKYKTQKPKDYDVMFMECIKEKFKWYCLNVIGMGFISDVAEYVVKKSKKLGAFSYPVGTVLALKEFKPYKTTIKYDSKKVFKSDKVFFIAFSNTKYSGGPIMVAPEAKHDDGLIDVTILYELNRLQFLNGFRKTFNGGHIRDKGCLYFKVKNAVVHADPDFILMPDGELEGKSPVKISIIKKQIKLIV
jgi:YegS/Rv2252/BmrU family lipid kinase